MDALPLKEFRRLDLNSEEQGVPVTTLMARAGKELAKAARDMADGQPIVLLCGRGNNGGDGFAAAGVLHRWNIPFTVVLMEPPRAIRGTAARSYFDLLPAAHVAKWGPRRPWRGLVVDCLLGSGIRGRPRAPYDQAIRWVNKQPMVLSCDVPSGLGTPLAVTPHATLTFHAAKAGMTAANSGTVTVVDIGIPKDAESVGLGDLDAGYVRPGHDSHKGDNGRVLIVGGGPFTGAPHYAGMGAVRSGADLVHVATTEAAAAILSSWGPDLLVHGVSATSHLGSEGLPALRKLLKRVDAVVVGPGLGDADREVVQSVLAAGLPTVIDADALGMLDGVDLTGRPVILTPHAREFQRLAGRKATPAAAKALARRLRCTVLLKGRIDIITDGERLRRCHRGHPAMTSGGTGDVLAGVCGALLAKGAGAFDSACAAAYLVGCAGEVAGSLRSYGATATDVHEAIPAVLLRLD